MKRMKIHALVTLLAAMVLWAAPAWAVAPEDVGPPAGLPGGNLAEAVQILAAKVAALEAAIKPVGADCVAVQQGKFGPSPLDLQYCDLSHTYMKSGANLVGANLTGADLSGSRSDTVNLTDANLTGANLSGLHWDTAIMERANLTGANLSGAYLEEAWLIDAILVDTNLTSTDLGDTRMAGTDLTGATWNYTICPDFTNSGNSGDCTGHF